MGLRGDDWFITPLELEALIKRHGIMQRGGLVGSAMICATLANINRDSSKRAEPFTVEDFLPSSEVARGSTETEPNEFARAKARLDQWRGATGAVKILGAK